MSPHPHQLLGISSVSQLSPLIAGCVCISPITNAAERQNIVALWSDPFMKWLFESFPFIDRVVSVLVICGSSSYILAGALC